MNWLNSINRMTLLACQSVLIASWFPRHEVLEIVIVIVLIVIVIVIVILILIVIVIVMKMKINTLNHSTLARPN